ncbi:helix-turn-helix domain-containing protein [Sphingomonas lacusdianchii]
MALSSSRCKFAVSDPVGIHALHAEGVGPTEIAKRLGVGRASVYRALAA